MRQTNAIDVFLATREMRRFNWYDSFTAPVDRDYYGNFTSGRRLFGNMNIGSPAKCNLQIPGQLGSDSMAVIDHWYARTDLPSTTPLAVRAAFERWAMNATVTLVVGDKPRWMLDLGDLLRERPWMPEDRVNELLNPEEIEQRRARRLEGHVPMVVPQRQCFSARVDADVGPLLDAFDAWLGADYNHDVEPAADHVLKASPRIWVHIEGVEIRGG